MSTVVIRSAHPTPLLEHLSPVAMWRNLRGHADLIRQFASRELVERNKGAVLGVAWNILNPILTLAVYTFIFGFVMRVSWEKRGGQAWEGMDPHVSFALTLFCGHTIFHVFGEMANRSPALIAARPNLVRKVVFPLEILPVSLLASSMVYVAICAAILLVCLLAFAGSIQWTVVLFPLVLLPLAMLTLGVGWALAALGVFIRDMRNMVGVITHVLMFMSGVFYPAEKVPEAFRWLVVYNPLAVLIDEGRNVLLWGAMPDWTKLGILTIGGFVVMQVGYAVFMKSRRGFADVV